jgi:hypothetical protein
MMEESKKAKSGRILSPARFGPSGPWIICSARRENCCNGYGLFASTP